MKSHFDRILDLTRRHGLIRPRDLVEKGLPRITLTRMVRTGQLIRVGRGLYALPDRLISEHAPLAEASHKHPRAIVCLLSALRFHNLTNQPDPKVWLAIPNKARAPREDYPPLHIVRFSGVGLTEGVEKHVIDGVSVRMTSVARTIADCFKYRNKIGLDVAIEALSIACAQHRIGIEELWRYAKICRVANVIRPYIEAVA